MGRSQRADSPPPADPYEGLDFGSAEFADRDPPVGWPLPLQEVAHQLHFAAGEGEAAPDDQEEGVAEELGPRQPKKARKKQLSAAHLDIIKAESAAGLVYKLIAEK